MSGPPEEHRSHVAGIQHREDREREEREREQYERGVRAINSLTTQLDTNQTRQDASDDKRAFREKLTIFLVLATVTATIIGDGIFYETMQDARAAASNANEKSQAALIVAARTNQKALDESALENRKTLASEDRASVKQYAAMQSQIDVMRTQREDFVAQNLPDFVPDDPFFLFTEGKDNSGNIVGWSATPRFHNVGETKAANVISWRWPYLADTSDMHGLTMGETAVRLRPHCPLVPTNLSTENEANVGRGSPLGLESVVIFSNVGNDLAIRNHALLVTTYLEWDDLFKTPTSHHFKTYCWWLIPADLNAMKWEQIPIDEHGK